MLARVMRIGAEAARGHVRSALRAFLASHAEHSARERAARAEHTDGARMLRALLAPVA